MGDGESGFGDGECVTILGHTGRYGNKGPANAGQPSYSIILLALYYNSGYIQMVRGSSTVASSFYIKFIDGLKMQSVWQNER